MSLRLRYSREFLRRDIIAALTVAAISLPQGMAYALLAGVDPRYGLFSAIQVTFVASVFGSSSHLINGPTSAISLVVFSSLSMFDPDQRIEAAEAMFLLGARIRRSSPRSARSARGFPLRTRQALSCITKFDGTRRRRKDAAPTDADLWGP